jgi:hypothetical protein
METQPTAALFPRERVNGNVRFRLHRFQTDDGAKYGVEVSAYNRFADQWKLQQFIAGLDLQPATELFNELVGTVRGYCWIDDEYLTEDGQ